MNICYARFLVPCIIRVHRNVHTTAIPNTRIKGVLITSTANGENIDASPAAMLHPPYTVEANLAGNNSYTMKKFSQLSRVIANLIKNIKGIPRSSIPPKNK
jgi:hypothetical protein